VNANRGGGSYLFGSDATNFFLVRNNLQMLIRSHEVQMAGYNVHHGGKCITVFSAPNYCGDVGNAGAIVKCSGKEEELRGSILQFHHKK
jgi:serine/threonine-protein phosphatase 5